MSVRVAYLDGRAPPTSSADKGKGRAKDTVEVEFVPFENDEDELEAIRLLYRCVSVLQLILGFVIRMLNNFAGLATTTFWSGETANQR